MVDANGERARLRVAVVFGGRSSEHAISCVSAGTVMEALMQSGYDVVPVGITPEGRWVLTSSDRSQLEIRDRVLPNVKDGLEVVLPADPASRGLLRLEDRRTLDTDGVRNLGNVDVVFPVLHGAYGEDGTIQGLLEMAGLPYVGAGVLSSAVSMDKEYTKRLLEGAGLPTGPYAVLRPGQEITPEIRTHLGLPLFVKPARAGSSIGVSKAVTDDEVDEAIRLAREIDPKVILESAVIGREIECGVLEAETLGADPDTSMPAEIRILSGHDWYDFDAKYLDDACEFDVPAKLSEKQTAEVRRLAAQTFTVLDCAGLARVDFFVTDTEVFINEVNTMPGFTTISMFPRMWEAAGVSYPALVSRLVETALRRGTGLR